ncbi:GntR family transcriptional regulator [Tropicimonas sediminicola]|uniref:Transcriptional regulator, GntR family n=1 Tax=Tropicimonas sediminicola TaxID=1031541 RepID=A0A239CD35_9RHOB|nr:GntR family transcriptional regulator [Tropicimonas sediminicola]SNS17551.1 transcriptional regulator, GntR family [Tropicimonas sediminicola]
MTKSSARTGGTLAKQVESQIEQDIVEGVFLPGDRLDEEELAARLNTSRTPIREALRTLASIGLVAVRPRSGATVSRPTMSEVIDLFEVVAEMEAFAARLAATRATDAELRTVAEMHDACEREAGTGDAQRYFDANGHFHRSIWEGAHNPMLVEQIRIVDRRVSPYRRQITFHPGRQSSSQTEHRQIADALAARDAEAAAEAMRDHVMILSDDALQLSRHLRL